MLNILLGFFLVISIFILIQRQTQKLVFVLYSKDKDNADKDYKFLRESVVSQDAFSLIQNYCFLIVKGYH